MLGFSDVLLNPQNGFCLLNCALLMGFTPLAVVAQQEPKYFAERWCEDLVGGRVIGGRLKLQRRPGWVGREGEHGP